MQFLDICAKQATQSNNLQLRGPSSLYSNLGLINPSRVLDQKIKEKLNEKLQKKGRSRVQNKSQAIKAYIPQQLV